MRGGIGLGRAGSSRESPREPTEFVGGSPPSKPKEQTSVLELRRSEAYLVITNGARREAEYVVRGDETTIGRDPGADITIDEPSASRRHATVVRRRDAFYLRDLGSTNGTYLRGLLHGERKRLVEGDRFRIGRTEFLFHARPAEEKE
jgi:pSer/pThr/pTyr-binding forkhead associated (FHA) protein